MSEAEEAPKKKKQKNKPKSSFKKVSAFLVGFIVVAVFAGSAFSFWLAKGFTRSWVLQEEKVVVIPAGESPIYNRIVILANAGTQTIKTTGFPLSRE